METLQLKSIAIQIFSLLKQIQMEMFIKLLNDVFSMDIINPVLWFELVVNNIIIMVNNGQRLRKPMIANQWCIDKYMSKIHHSR